MAPIVGRDLELGVLEALLEQSAERRGAALVLRGEAGIGKSALLDRAVQSARERGVRVLSVTGVQAEMQIPYAGLEHLLRPLKPGSLHPESPFRQAIEVLELLGAPDEPVLLAVEDAHWLDVPTWDTLALLSRRIESDRIAVVMAVRNGEDIDRRLSAAGLPELQLEPLPADDAGTLLDLTAPGLTPALRSRVLDESAGNPLGIVELGASAARSGGSALLPSSLPLSARVERTFGGLVAELPAQCRELLLIAALDDEPNLDEVLAAASILAGAPVPAEAVQPAVTARLVVVDERYDLRFRHPLLRSALRQQAAPPDRRRVHAALAEVLAARPDRSLWHRASAASGPDEQLARELADAAVAAAQYQAVATAFAAVSRAVQLSEDVGSRGSRQIWALSLAYEQGDSEAVGRLLGEVDESALRLVDRARLTWIRESVDQSIWSGPERLLFYADLIEAMCDGGEPALAAKALSEIALRIFYSNIPQPVRDRFTEVALNIGLPKDDPVLTQALVLISPVEHGRAGLENLQRLVNRIDLAASLRAELATAGIAIGAWPISYNLALSAATELRRQGRVGLLTQALSAAAAASSALGDTRAALPLAVECLALSEETGQRNWAVGANLSVALCLALRGDVAEARRLADLGEQMVFASGLIPMLAHVQWVRGFAALAEGRADDAFRQLMRVFEPTDRAYFPNYHPLVLGCLAEAVVLGGFREELRPIVSRLEPVAEQGGSPALRVGLTFARAVLDGDYAAALAEDLADWPFERARLQLAYGASLRRSFRITECRPLLRSAADTFDALGAMPWSDRARRELRATGETRHGRIDALAELTPQEQQISRLVAQGLSNREIGERLFLSPRTVSTHLYRIFPKVNATSRADLTRLVTSSDVV
jgi:DNA-binding CsgD family transcriptional regulator